jgi:BirA family biotin operon repressor/biotin-[acetyl-CoA-carboxylase] ligase
MEQDNPVPETARGPLDRSRLGAEFAAGAGLSRVEVVDEVGSTNTELTRLAGVEGEDWGDLAVLVAEHQTHGQGRLHRLWESPAGASLAVSILLRPHGSLGRPLPTQVYSWFSPLAALALREALGRVAGLESALKWPNDVVVNGLKVSGILAHLAPGAHGEPPAVVLGTGINVSLTENELPVPTATSASLAAGRPVDRTALLVAYLEEFATHYRAFCAVDGNADAPFLGGQSLLSRVQDATITLGRRVRVDLPGGRRLEGRATGLDGHGALQVIEDDGERHAVSAGDVVHLRPADGGYA